MTGNEDRNDGCQPSGCHGAGHPGLSDGSERHDCDEHQRQRAEPQNLAPLQERQSLAKLLVYASRGQ
jgi:hypothetical protein